MSRDTHTLIKVYTNNYTYNWLPNSKIGLLLESSLIGGLWRAKYAIHYLYLIIIADNGSLFIRFIFCDRFIHYSVLNFNTISCFSIFISFFSFVFIINRIINYTFSYLYCAEIEFEMFI